MNKKVILFFYCLVFSFFIQKSNAQVANDAIGARSIGMGGYTATLSDLWSANNNQAGLGFVKQLSGGIYYEYRFLLSETSYKAGAFVLPTKVGALGVSVTSFGFELYNETKAGLSYGQRFGEKFSFGVQMNYINTKLTQQYGSKSSITGAVGLMAKLSNELTLGVHIYNPTRTKLANDNNERIPTIMKLGLAYNFSKKMLFAMETEKDVDYQAIVKVGIEYHIIDILYLRGGISTGPTLSSFGFGLQLKDFMLGIASNYHQTLGLTPSISIVYRKNKSTKKSTSPSI